MKMIRLLKTKRLQLILSWCDFWIGLYHDIEHKTLYICPLPMIVLRFEMTGSKDYFFKKNEINKKGEGLSLLVKYKNPKAFSFAGFVEKNSRGDFLRYDSIEDWENYIYFKYGSLNSYLYEFYLFPESSIDKLIPFSKIIE